ncbi:hypothetical protein D9M71_730060 [compost metagenome]
MPDQQQAARAQAGQQAMNHALLLILTEIGQQIAQKNHIEQPQVASQRLDQVDLAKRQALPQGRSHAHAPGHLADATQAVTLQPAFRKITGLGNLVDAFGCLL